MFVKVVDEDYEYGDDGMCGKWDVSMRGARDVALNRRQHYCKHLASIGFAQGIATSRAFHFPANRNEIFVHCADYVASGLESPFEWFSEGKKKAYECKIQMLGMGA